MKIEETEKHYINIYQATPTKFVKRNDLIFWEVVRSKKSKFILTMHDCKKNSSPNHYSN